MAAFARWTNLSETTFLLPPSEPGADYRARIFTPTVELPFAGHPTLGSCHAWLAAGGQPRNAGEVVQQCGVGLVRIRRDGARLAFAAPPRRRSGPLDEALLERIAAMLQLRRDEIVAHQHCDNGPGWVAVMLRSAEAVRALKPAFGGERSIELGVVGAGAANAAANPTANPAGAAASEFKAKVGALGAQAPGQDTAFELRAFFPSPNGMAEDPVTGSLNAAVAQWLIGDGLAPERYVAAQGSALGRAGRVFIERRGADIWVGGHVAGCIEGRVSL